MKAVLLLSESKWRTVHRGARQVVGALGELAKPKDGDDPRAMPGNSDSE